MKQNNVEKIAFHKFYSELTKKIEKLNKNIDNKYQLHICDKCDKSDNLIKFDVVEQRDGFKPNGLWTSGLYGSNNKDVFWTDWLKSEMPEWGNPNKFKFFIIKFDKSKILQITTKDEYNNFCKTYLKKKELEKSVKVSLINWPKVSKKYKGINITPYRWDSRHNIWYYGWDCASQCVWDKSAIIEIQEVDVNNIKKKFYSNIIPEKDMI